MSRHLVGCAILLFPALAFAQVPPECAVPAGANPINPTRVCFIASVDHAMVTTLKSVR